MSIDALPESENIEQRTERLAREGETQRLIDQVAYDGYDGDERMRFLPVTTYHEGVVYLGGDADEQTVPLNNGQIIVVPRNENVDVTVFRVETNRGKLGRARPVLAQYHVDGVMGPEPGITVDEKQPIQNATGIALDVEQFGFVKAVRAGSIRPFRSPAAQELMERGALTKQQRAEFGIVGASLRALENSGLFTR